MLIYRTVLMRGVAAVLAVATSGVARSTISETINSPSEIADILDQIARETRVNFEKIESWKGKYEIVTESRDMLKRRLMSDEATWDGKPYLTVIEAELSFAIVPAKECWQLKYEQTKPPSFKALNGKAIAFKSGRFVQESILTPESYLSFRPRQTYGEIEGFSTSLGPGQSRSRVAFVRHRTDPDSERSTTGALVDPLLFFGNGSLYTWERCSRYAKRIREGTFTADQLSRIHLEKEVTDEGIRYTLRVKYEADTPNASDALVATDVYTQVTGFNLVHWHKERAGKRYEEWDFQFSKKDSILYPELVRLMKTSLADGTRESSNTYRSVECLFNKPIAKEEFALTAFNLANGERVADEIAGTVKAYKDNSLVPLHEFGYGIHKARPADLRNWFIAANVAVVLGLLLFVTQKRLRTRGA